MLSMPPPLPDPVRPRRARAQVVDMFGCGLPVCAAAYACIGELVAHGDSGLLFAGPGQLASQLAELLAGFPGAEGRALARMRHTAAAAAAVTWGASWRSVVLPLFAA
jgi:beta-1,4-mannosyltransferase